jgi:hypothetical protein
MRLTSVVVLAIGACAIFGACGGGSSGPKAGDERGACYGNGSCNAGLTCASNVCVRIAGNGGTTGDAGMTGTAGNGGSAAAGTTGAGGIA